QLCERFEEVVAAALEITDGCPSGCARGCIDYLFTFRNAFFHKHLNRHVAAERFKAWADVLLVQHDIPPKLPTEGRGLARVLSTRKRRSFAQCCSAPAFRTRAGGTRFLSGCRLTLRGPIAFSPETIPTIRARAYTWMGSASISTETPPRETATEGFARNS